MQSSGLRRAVIAALFGRFITQLLGVISIFITAMFGMFKNLYVVPGVF